MVVRRAAAFGKAGHAALETVAVDIAEAGNRQTIADRCTHRRVGAGIALHQADHAIIDGNEYPFAPVLTDQRALEQKLALRLGLHVLMYIQM